MSKVRNTFQPEATECLHRGEKTETGEGGAGEEEEGRMIGGNIEL